MSTLGKNIWANILGQGAVAVLGFVAIRYVFRGLGEDALGLIYFALMANSVLCGLLELGICSTTVREVSAYFLSDPRYTISLLQTASAFYWVVYVVLVCITWMVAPILVTDWLHLKMMDVPTATLLLRILIPAVLLSFPRSLYNSAFRGLQRMEINNWIDVLTVGLQQLGLAVILVCKGSLRIAIYWIAASFSLGFLMYLICMMRFFPWRALLPCYSNEVIRRVARYAKSMMVMSILGIVYLHADKLIISHLLPIGVLGYYGFAYNAVARAAILTSAVAQAALPLFSRLSSQGNGEALATEYRKLQDLLCIGSAPLLAAVFFCLPAVLRFVFDSDIAHQLVIPISLLALGFYLGATWYIPYVHSLAVGKPQISERSSMWTLVIVLPLAFLLVYCFGLAGAGASFLAAQVFAYCYTVPRFCSECLYLAPWSWFSHISRILLWVGLVYVLPGIVFYWVAHVSLYSAIGAYLVTSTVYIVGAYRLMSPDLRLVFKRYCRLLLPTRGQSTVPCTAVDR